MRGGTLAPGRHLGGDGVRLRRGAFSPRREELNPCTSTSWAAATQRQHHPRHPARRRGRRRGLGEIVSGLERFQDGEPCACGAAMRDCSFWSGVRRRFEAEGLDWDELAALSRWQTDVRRWPTTRLARTDEPKRVRLAAMTEALAWAVAAESDKPHVLDSNKEIARGLFLLRYLPAAPVIHLVRDPRGIQQSQLADHRQRPRHQIHASPLAIRRRRRQAAPAAALGRLVDGGQRLVRARRQRRAGPRAPRALRGPARRPGRGVAADRGHVRAAARGRGLRGRARQAVPVGHARGPTSATRAGSDSTRRPSGRARPCRAGWRRRPWPCAGP